jgi:hypothetical protein
MFRLARHQKGRNRPKGTKGEVSAYKKRVRTISSLVTLVVVFALSVVVFYHLIGYFKGPEPAIDETYGDSGDNSLKAALIDSLYGTHPNVEFTRSFNETLKEAGFEVDIYQGEEVTVGFLKKLTGGYKLIVLRMHSALSAKNELYLFTAEPYSAGKYAQEQYFQLVKEAYATEDSQPVFAVNWGFIKRLMTGKFSGTLVVAMGCDGALDPLMAQEFINQGAVGYVAWDGPVLLSHSDEAIMYLVQALYMEKLPSEEAVERTSSEIGEDPHWGTVLNCYVP